MYNDKDLIFEKYTNKVLVLEFPVYASSTYTDPNKALHTPSDPDAGGAGYAIGTYATKANLDPYDVALTIADLVKTRLFKPGNNTYKGISYDLEYTGSRDQLEKEIQGIITDEFAAKGHKTHFRQAKNAAREIAGKVLNVSREVGSAGPSIPSAPKSVTPSTTPKIIAVASKDVDDVFERIFKAKISHPPSLDLNSTYKAGGVDPSDELAAKFNTERAKRAANVYYIFAAGSNPEEWPNTDLTVTSKHEFTGAELMTLISRRLGYPFTIAKEAINDLIRNGFIHKVISP